MHTILNRLINTILLCLSVVVLVQWECMIVIVFKGRHCNGKTSRSSRPFGPHLSRLCAPPVWRAPHFEKRWIRQRTETFTHTHRHTDTHTLTHTQAHTHTQTHTHTHTHTMNSEHYLRE